MTTQTFDDAIATHTTEGQHQLKDLQASLKPTLKTLKQQQRDFSEKKPAWLSRVATAQGRRNAAVARGVMHPRCEYLLSTLAGSMASQGLVQDTENTIASFIQTIESLSLKNFPHRNYSLTWFSFPQRVLDNENAIEQCLEELETLVADGGELHVMVSAHSAQKEI